ncbi:hypothetical protein BC374_06135 [Ensifer sp. LC13]|nr:hypothetical protein BC362_22955 [Ensifer sp. LC14]OCP03189.1 hypothetical protein BBX50_06075 [Ensifer sp. LC11]OCP03560.1 hypothetical protein BC374_06135 [Ensifer sp. LC13]OCP33973.1 hypothetical protein BC364_13625 [Ensifer sp. LC499]
MMFARWDIPPGRGEPAHGFLLRLVREQGIPSLATFNVWNEVADNGVRHDRSLNILDQHPLPKGWKSHLRHATPRIVGDCVEIGGQTLKKNQVSTNPRRWCPACLAEKAYHRVWWEVVCVRRCPYHGLPLESRDAGGGVVSWTWTDFETSRNGYVMTRFDAPAYSERTFARYMIGRMGFDSPISHALFDQYEIRDVIRFCEMYGKFLANGYVKSVPDTRIDDIDIGFRASDSRATLTDNLRSWLRKNSRIDPNVPGLENVFGWLQKSHSFLKDKQMQAMSRAICQQARSLEGEGVTRPTREDDFDVKHTSIRALAVELNMSERGVLCLAEELGVLNRARVKSGIPTDAADRIRVFSDSLMTPSETAERLGIHTDALRSLRRAGYLKVFVGLSRGKRNGARFDRARVDGILAAIQAIEAQGDRDRGISFAAYCTRKRMTVGALALEVLNGRRAITNKGVGGCGFGGLRIEAEKLVKSLPPERAEFMNVREAVAALNLSNNTILGLVEKGALGQVTRRGAEVWLKKSAVTAFGKKHSKVADFESGLSLHPTMILRRLSGMNVEPVLAGYRGRHRMETVVRRRDVLKVFGLSDDPTRITDERFVAFWKRIVRLTRLGRPTLYLPDMLPAQGQRVWESCSRLSVLLRFDVDASELDALIVPSGGPREPFRLTLDSTDAQIITFLGLIEMRAKEARAKVLERTGKRGRREVGDG